MNVFLRRFAGLLACAALPLQAATPESFHVDARSYSTRPESEPPAYVRAALDVGPGVLDLGLEHRERLELRDDDLRRPDVSGFDHPRFARSRLFLAYRDELQPLRFTLEYQDSRRYGGRFPRDNREVNEHEFIQRYAELHWPAALGHDVRGQPRPLSVRAGRMTFEALDRRLIGRNEWRNTSNSFSGARVLLGGQANDWQLDLLWLQPLTRRLEESDLRDRSQRFVGAIGHWRRWSEHLTLQPYYLGLRQEPRPDNGEVGRRVHAFGLRAYGELGAAVDWDVNAIIQSGHQGELAHRAQGLTAELGRTWREHRWRPRLSLSYGYASGDRDPDDDRVQRFERFFGFARPWSADDYVIFENIHAPKLRVELQPSARLRLDAGYSAYWLASGKDRFNNLLAGSGNRDASGESGRFLGHGPDLRLRYALAERLDLSLGYSHFFTEQFVRARQQQTTGASAADSDFFYLEFTFNGFRRGG